MIEFSQFNYAYPTSTAPVLRDIAVTIPEGQVCGLVGPSGAGKSTLAYAAAGLIPHALGGEFTGSVTTAGRVVADTPLAEVVTEVGLVLQNPFNQISGAKYTVREELAFGLENLGVARPEMVSRIDGMLERLQITHLADRSPYELSGGQQQLVALAAVLVMQPRVLVLDEPTSQLDPAGSRLVFTALDELRDSGITVLLVEHKLEQLAEYTDRLLVLVGGSVQLDGPPEEVLADPRLPEWGVGTTRFTDVARRAAELGRWPTERPLPVTLPAAVAGFTESLGDAG
ncbi:energy-coupling factor ABC transporter ATP-binding protein [Saccharopolyspora sp. 5N708]|uniref:energy-coupling factor ABC transporter ATP-binding protein n=1 Tax=Saccharopolyspora sp. 5N708 TaxID=3457424 RepID=UPI003FCFAC5B